MVRALQVLHELARRAALRDKADVRGDFVVRDLALAEGLDPFFSCFHAKVSQVTRSSVSSIHAR